MIDNTHICERNSVNVKIMFMIYVKIYAQIIKICLKRVLVYETKFIWSMLLMNSSISLFFLSPQMDQ